MRDDYGDILLEILYTLDHKLLARWATYTSPMENLLDTWIDIWDKIHFLSAYDRPCKYILNGHVWIGYLKQNDGSTMGAGWGETLSNMSSSDRALSRYTEVEE